MGMSLTAKLLQDVLMDPLPCAEADHCTDPLDNPLIVFHLRMLSGELVIIVELFLKPFVPTTAFNLFMVVGSWPLSKFSIH